MFGGFITSGICLFYSGDVLGVYETSGQTVLSHVNRDLVPRVYHAAITDPTMLPANIGDASENKDFLIEVYTQRNTAMIVRKTYPGTKYSNNNYSNNISRSCKHLPQFGRHLLLLMLYL